MTRQAILDSNKDKWNRVFINYEQYKLVQAKNYEEILSLTEWLMKKYKPVKVYFPKGEGLNTHPHKKGGNRWTKY